MVTTHLLGAPTPVRLGRLVTNANRPHQDFLDPLPPRPDSSECHLTYHQAFSEFRAFTKSSRLTLGLGELLALRLTTFTGGTTTFTAENTTTQDLENSDAWFGGVCRGEDASLAGKGYR